MSSVALDANVTIKKNKTLKKEYQVGDSLVYKDYVAPGPTGTIAIEKVSLGTDSSDNAHLGLQGTGPSVTLGNITGSSGSYGNSILRLERDKLAFQVPTASSLGSFDYGTSGHVLTSGGSSSAMSWAAPSITAGANNTFTGTNTFEEDVTFDEAVHLESGATSKSNLVIKDGANNTKLTLGNDGRIGIGSSVNYGTSGHVLTSGGSGTVSWTAMSGASLSANNTFTGTNTFNQDVILGSNNITTGEGAQKYHDYRALGYAALLNSTTLTAYNYGTTSDSINFYPKTIFHSPVEFNGKVPGAKIGAVTGEAATAMFSSGSIANTRFEVDNGNLVVKGQNTVDGADVDNAVYSADFKNLAGEKIIVPSTTAFDPTKDDRTGTMKAIHNYIGTFIDIVPPVFAGGRFASGASNTATGTVGSTFNPFTYSSPNVTCTDSPTAGPNKGTTTTFTLGADHFEFINTTTSSGAVVPGTTVVPIGNVFDNLTGPIYRYSTTLSGSGVNVLGTNLNGFKLKWDADGGFYFRLTTDSSAGIGNIAFLYTNSTTGNWAYPNVNIAGDSTRILFMLGTAGSAYLQAKYTYSFSASTEYELYITWQAMSHTDTSAPDDSDIIFGIRPTGGTWSTGAGTALNDTSEMFTGSGLSSEYFKLEGNESSSLLALNWNGASNPSTGSMQEARLYNRYITETILNEPIAWQASSTWKTAGTYYLRYKATDAAGNETPNDADHYLTITVPKPIPVAGQLTYDGTTYTLGSSYSFPITSSSSTKTIARADLGSTTWDGWGSDKAWTLYYQYTTPSTAPSSPADTNGFMRFSNEGGAQDVWVGTQTIDSSGNRLNAFYFNGSWSEYIGSASNPMYLSYDFAASTKYSVVIAFDGTSNAGSQPDADQFCIYIRDDTNSGSWSSQYNFTSNLDTFTATDSALDMTSHDLVLMSPTSSWSGSDYGSIHALGFWNVKLNSGELP